MKYFIILLMSIFLFTATPIVTANSNVVKPVKELPSIQETSDKDIISYRKRRRRPRPHYRKHRPRPRIIIIKKRKRRPRPHYRRHRGCFIDAASAEFFNADSIISWLLDK